MGTKRPRVIPTNAAGVAVAVLPPGETRLPCGVPKTGYASEAMAELSVH